MVSGVIFHIDENDKWEVLLHNVKNLLLACKSSEYTVEVLANGDAVASYAAASTNIEQLMNELEKLNVTFVACNNSIHGMEINTENLLAFVKVVPTGVLELIQKQNEGYAYIKP
jgi:uncharacterized protein